MTSAVITKYAYIDALRGLAIVGVVAVHASQIVLPASDGLALLMYLGRRGVQLFYVASALTLCLSWQRRSIDESAPVRNFYLRRWFRIAPLFYLALPAYLWLNGFAPGYWAPAGIGIRQVVLPLLFLHGFQPDTINVPVPGSWSIAVEMCFYLLFPLLITVATGISRVVAMLVASTGIYYLVSWLIMAWYHDSVLPLYLVSEFVDLNPLSELPVFCFGMLAFHLVRTPLPPRELSLIGCMTLAVLTVFFLYPVSTIPHHIISGGLFANLAVLLARWPISLLVNWLTVTLGKLSYGLYLCHFAVLTLLVKSGVNQWFSQSDGAALTFFALVLAVSSVIAFGCHRWLEQPCIQAGSKLIDRFERNRKAASAGTVPAN